MDPNEWGPILIVGVGFGLLALLVTAIWFSRSLQRQQERDHAERMKALEMGFYVPPHESPWPRTIACVSIGGIVPLGTFVCAAWMTSLTVPESIQATVWGLTFMVSTMAVGCATSLASRLPRSSDRVKETAATGKPPAFDPESFEAISAYSNRGGRG
ncbi:hypothetical protein [Singulisphaera acidiphila]|uniref:Uncharacterized protein n=1 Tax=Singulisphaera acidiphila (strain ATCC BAA-1392 / DSM 18658 / VKM B-2454 / MOB10) TaxID=886293 RepID=L0DF80_SINAD|nr:hypothetical protein [Singulisphaera acidiphila]AGA27510.1 hypothetical protein Sinac_3238 [Singulisphaera acidiphila DSM 18658]